VRIAIVGAGYVGLVTAACFAEFGFEVVAIDRDHNRVARLRDGDVPIYEPGLDGLIEKNVRAERLRFSDDLAASVAGCAAVFIAVGTPSRRGDGHADLTYVYAAAEAVARAMDEGTVVVTKSTVPVGTGREVAAIIARTRPECTFSMASNPEFLREGSAIGDFMRPDRVIIGAESEAAFDVLRQLYRPLYLIETPVLETSIETAELTKYATNAFLATKITFINQMADLCEKVGANVHDVARGLGLDGRIGPKFLHPGPGFGGSCFPKDTRALIRTGVEYEAPLSIVETVIAANDARKQAMGERVRQALGGSARDKTVALLGTTFKPNTDDMRESPAIDIAAALSADGATVRAYDPEGMEQARPVMPEVHWCRDSYDAARGADVCVLVTEWNEFRALDLAKLKQVMAVPHMVDLRNVYDPADMRTHGFVYHSIGRPLRDAEAGGAAGLS
jgi:UDPglucose 6-dehydrogenase